ncbi:MAG: thioredoxin domain-containing protein [Alphaproteobacteria bacterium]|nr:thioredoxin domain-containing protein [Alphaproteobacteria bacterium]
MAAEKGRNRLSETTSPYLLQHKDNPVHWWPWGEEALAEAKATGKPILLSVGYAACHWCHVMAHESFENVEIAAVMNDLFVNVKVDREERPDIDAIYMGALHMMGEQGGWPLTMFLDTEARPFFGGTYFPPTARFGRPGLKEVLENIARIYREEPDRVRHNAEAITQALGDRSAGSSGILVSDRLLSDLTQRMAGVVDPQHGGIQGAPKFPQWSFFWMMWRGAIRYQNSQAANAVEKTLTHICQGGIYDHLAGGFARYSVDEKWLAPHFEKMLYDNALLIDLMTEVWRETKNPLLKLRIAETVDWLEREMIADGGAFAASLDADSEGEEGKFYVWSRAEIERVLGKEDAELFSSVYDVSEAGNWEGKNILNRLGSLGLMSQEEENRLQGLRGKLLAYRAQRIRPGWDDKVLADWNGLTIAALSRAAVVFDRADWLERAENAFAFIVEKMSLDGRLRHSWRAGKLGAAATAGDYANMTWAALRLFQASGTPGYLARAENWADVLHAHYWLRDERRYATTADDTKDVLVRLANGTDDAVPSANAIQLSNLAHLAVLTGSQTYAEQAMSVLESFSPDIQKNLVAHTGLLAASMDAMSPQQVVIADGVGRPAMVETLHGISLPGALEHILSGPDASGAAAALDGKSSKDGKATVFACLGPQCSEPLTNAEAVVAVLKEQRKARV